MPTPSLHPLEPVVRDYAWGSRTVLAELRGRPAPTERPEAELWFGAHHTAPSLLADGRTLLGLIDADPGGVLGEEVAARFDGRLPFLVKLLAADQPLSLQAHPSAEQARAGFEREERTGRPVDAPDRCYRDPWPKPELLHALTEVDALCGFRSTADTLDLLDALDVAGLADLRGAVERAGDDGLAALFADQLRAPVWSPAVRGEVAAAARRVAAAGGPHGAEARWLAELLERYPDDPGVRVAALLRHVSLAPGQALALPAGNLHAYLHGAGVEVMAASDNVVRGGLTTKHVDVDELLRTVDARVLPPPLVGPSVDGPVATFPGPTDHFALQRVQLGSGAATDLARERGGPEILVAVGGQVQVRDAGAVVTLPPGGGALVTAAAGPLHVAGRGQLFRVTVGW